MHEICLCSCDAPKLTVRLRELESVKLSAKAQEMQFSVYSLREPGRDSGPGSKSNNQTHLTPPFGFWLLAFGFWLLASGFWLLAVAWLLALAWLVNCIGVHFSDAE